MPHTKWTQLRRLLSLLTSANLFPVEKKSCVLSSFKPAYSHWASIWWPQLQRIEVTFGGSARPGSTVMAHGCSQYFSNLTRIHMQHDVSQNSSIPLREIRSEKKKHFCKIPRRCKNKQTLEVQMTCSKHNSTNWKFSLFKLAGHSTGLPRLFFLAETREEAKHARQPLVFASLFSNHYRGDRSKVHTCKLDGG